MKKIFSCLILCCAINSNAFALTYDEAIQEIKNNGFYIIKQSESLVFGRKNNQEYGESIFYLKNTNGNIKYRYLFKPREYRGIGMYGNWALASYKNSKYTKIYYKDKRIFGIAKEDYIDIKGENLIVTGDKKGTEVYYQNKKLKNFKFDFVKAENNVLVVKQNNKYGAFKNNGEKLLDVKYSNITVEGEKIKAVDSKEEIEILNPCYNQIQEMQKEEKTAKLNKESVKTKTELKDKEVECKVGLTEDFKFYFLEKNKTYDEKYINIFSNDEMEDYFFFAKDGKFGAYYKGKKLFDSVENEFKMFDKYIAVKKNGKWGLFKEDKQIYDYEFKDINFSSVFTILQTDEGKFKMLNTNPEFEKYEYDKVFDMGAGYAGFRNNILTVYFKDNLKYEGHCDNVKLIGSYLIIESDSKMGVIYYNGNKITDTKYDEIKEGYAGSLTVIKKNKIGFIRDENLVDAQFDEIKPNYNITYVKNNGKWGLYMLNDLIIPIKYDSVKESKDNNYIVENNGKKGVIKADFDKKTANTVIPVKYDDIASTSNGYLATLKEKEIFIKTKN